MSAVSVGNLLAKDPTSITMGEFTLEKGHTNAVNAAGPLAIALASLNTKWFTAEKGLMRVGNVGNALPKFQPHSTSESSHWRKAL